MVNTKEQQGSYSNKLTVAKVKESGQYKFWTKEEGRESQVILDHKQWNMWVEGKTKSPGTSGGWIENGRCEEMKERLEAFFWINFNCKNCSKIGIIYGIQL